jgi:hypothetical protein
MQLPKNYVDAVSTALGTHAGLIYYQSARLLHLMELNKVLEMVCMIADTVGWCSSLCYRLEHIHR